MGKYILFTHFYPITADISDKMHIILKFHPIKKSSAFLQMIFLCRKMNYLSSL